jgi:lipoyl(octanoyl) transferase
MTLEIKISKKLIPYKLAFKFLKKRVDSLKKQKGKDLLWILEHPLTFTCGIRSKKNEILDKTIKVIETNRGGKITLHNPGQKIVYFVLNLNNKKKNIRNLVKQIEISIIEFLKLYNIKSNADKKNIGIWVGDKKIAAIGIKVSRWIAYHGCSVNINNNLEDYKKIIPCGLDNNKITSIQMESKKKVANINKNLKNIFIKNLKNI